MEQTEETSADARTEPGDEPQEPVPTEEGKGTQEEPFTTVAAYNEAVKGDALDGKDVYLTISRTEFKEEQFALTNVQTRPNPPRLHLTLTDCTFTGNTAGDKTNSSFMYLPNCQSLVIEDCTFDTGESSLKNMESTGTSAASRVPRWRSGAVPLRAAMRRMPSS